MTDHSKDLLIEQAASAYRQRNAWGRILQSPAWMDLAPEDRETAFRLQLESRVMERCLDRDRFSTTVRAVLSRLPSR